MAEPGFAALAAPPATNEIAMERPRDVGHDCEHRPMHTEIRVLLCACVLGLAACLPPGASSSSPPPQTVVRQTAFDRALIAAEAQRSTALADTCERGVEQQRGVLGSALDEAQAAALHGGAPLPPSKLLAGLRADGAPFSVTIGPTGLPVTSGSLSPSKSKRAAWMTAALRDEVGAFGAAYASARSVAFACRPRVELAEALYMAHTSGWREDEARERALLVRQIRAARGANVLAAAATGVLAAYQAASSGDHPEVADAALNGLGETLPLVAEVSDADVDAELIAVDEAVQARRANAARTGFDPGTAPTSVDVGTAAATQARAVPGAPPAPGMATASAQKPDLAALAVDRTLQLLPPAYRDVAKGVRAVADGDYKTAIKSVASYVPGPLGAALKGAAAFF